VKDWLEWSKTPQVNLPWDELCRLLDPWLHRVPPFADPFTHWLRKDHPAEISAILLYGSCLFEDTQSSTSFPDFYVLINSPKQYYDSRWHSLIHALLPPNVYYGSFPGGTPPRMLQCKYCVISVEQFLRETSPQASDFHHLGRFSKRFAMAYCRDEHASHVVRQGALQAIFTLIPHTLALLPSTFTLEDFIFQQLELSYLGEKRVVEPLKVKRLMHAAEAFYSQIYPAALRLYAERWGTVQATSPFTYRKQSSPHLPAPSLSRTHAFLRRSRRRGIFRWPKYMLTVDNWLQYILDKLERHQGVKVQLSSLQRRYPLLLGWPIYLELRRKGIIK
jgi:hypothetical protein